MFGLRKSLIFTLIFLVVASIANAALFDIEAVPINSKIALDEFAEFEIKVKNNLKDQEEFRIYTSNFPTWDVRTDPIINPISLDLQSGEQGSVKILVDPLKIREIGTYGININVRSKNTNILQNMPIKVTIMSAEGLIGGYVPTVLTSLGIPSKIDPRDEIPIKVVLNNQNIIDYPELKVKVESDLIMEEITTKLGPKDETTLEFTKKIDPLTAPGDMNVVIAVLREDKSIINPVVRKIEIVSYRNDELIEEQKKFMRSKKTYEVTSNDPDYEGQLKIETTMFNSLFSSESPKADILTESGKKYLVWDVELENNSMQVIVKKNFIPLFVVIILLIGLLIAYYVLRAPMTIRKETSNVTKRDGGVSEMSVILHLKNRGKEKLEDIEVTECIPSLVSIEKDISLGALQPNKVLKHEKKGNTVVKWNIDSLDVTEERVLSYRIKTQLPILGSFSLPGASSTFKCLGKKHKSSSNRLNVDE
ncbi:hypothetical protein ISS07_05775 [Candidatus Woesearchaeota archaeon]|nr:hypothetical protein [Candidatus Woesearchaeota archaeon]